MIILRKEKQFARKIPGQSGGARGLVRKGKILLRKGKKFITTNTPGTVVASVPQAMLEHPAFTTVWGATSFLPVPSTVLALGAEKAARNSSVYNGVANTVSNLYTGTPKSIMTNIGETFVKVRDKIYRIFTPPTNLQQRAIQRQVRENGLRKVRSTANKVDLKLPKPIREMTLKRTVGGTVDTALSLAKNITI